MVLSKIGIWSWKNACQVLAGAKKPAGVTYCGVKYAVPCGTQDFQLSRTTRSAACTWAVNRRTSGRWMSQASLSDGGTGGLDVGIPARLQGLFREDRDAEGFLGLLHRQLRQVHEAFG